MVCTRSTGWTPHRRGRSSPFRHRRRAQPVRGQPGRQEAAAQGMKTWRRSSHLQPSESSPDICCDSQLPGRLRRSSEALHPSIIVGQLIHVCPSRPCSIPTHKTTSPSPAHAAAAPQPRALGQQGKGKGRQSSFSGTGPGSAPTFALPLDAPIEQLRNLLGELHMSQPEAPPAVPLPGAGAPASPSTAPRRPSQAFRNDLREILAQAREAAGIRQSSPRPSTMPDATPASDLWVASTCTRHSAPSHEDSADCAPCTQPLAAL